MTRRTTPARARRRGADPELARLAAELGEAIDRVAALEPKRELAYASRRDVGEGFDRAQWDPACSALDRAQARLLDRMRALGAASVAAGGRLFLDPTKTVDFAVDHNAAECLVFHLADVVWG